MGEALTMNEAVSFVLKYSEKNKIKSTTTLQKTVARLQKYLVPLEFEFLLNQYGSDCESLRQSEGNDYFSKEEYSYAGGHGNCFILKERGLELAKSAEIKIKELVSDDEYKKLEEEISYVSGLSHDEASQNEHGMLLVDLKDREKLVTRINSVHIEIADLYRELNKPEDERTMTYNALVEYLYYLTKFLKEKRFKNIESEGYTYEKEMYDYYLLHNIENILKELKDDPSEEWLEKTYERFTEFGKANHIFSLENPELMELIK